MKSLSFLISDGEEEDTSSSKNLDTTTESEDEAVEERIQVEVTNRAYQNERKIPLATKHVKNARGMRMFLNEKIEKARNEVCNKVLWNDQTNVLISDYAQYMQLPFFGNNNQATVIILFR